MLGSLDRLIEGEVHVDNISSLSMKTSMCVWWRSHGLNRVEVEAMALVGSEEVFRGKQSVLTLFLL